MNVKNMKALLLLFIFISFSCHSDQYSMKSIGKNIFKSIEISNQKLTIAEAQFTWIDSLANYVERGIFNTENVIKKGFE